MTESRRRSTRHLPVGRRLGVLIAFVLWLTFVPFAAPMMEVQPLMTLLLLSPDRSAFGADPSRALLPGSGGMGHDGEQLARWQVEYLGGNEEKDS